MFERLLSQEVSQLNKTHTVLDIGCGSGIGRRSEPQEEIARQVGTLLGVEPDPEVEVPACFKKVWRSVLEDADIPQSSVDLAYSFMVMEHVENFDGYMKRLADVMRPGGVYIGATINAKCFFARVARVTACLGIQEKVLTIARGRREVEEYHYPAVYRMNTEPRLRALAAEYGFSRCEIFAVDSNEWFAYFPRPVRWCAHIIRAVFQRSHRNYPYLFIRLVK